MNLAHLSPCPSLLPRSLHREVVEYMVQHFKPQIFGDRKPVYDGKKNIYTVTALPIGNERVRAGRRAPSRQSDLPPAWEGPAKHDLLPCTYVIPSLPLPQVDFEVTIPGEGKDRIFKVSIKWMAIVSWRMLHEALVSGQIPVPLESVQALDVAMRHLASMRYLHQGLCHEHWTCKEGTSGPWRVVVAGTGPDGHWEEGAVPTALLGAITLGPPAVEVTRAMEAAARRGWGCLRSLPVGLACAV